MSNSFKNAAKKEKTKAGGLPEEIVAGKTLLPGVNPGEGEPQVEPAPATQPEIPQVVKEEPKPQEVTGNNLAASYAAMKGPEQEPRNVRLQVVITPSMNTKLNAHVANRKIRSKNDLVNFLLERYFEENN